MEEKSKWIYLNIFKLLDDLKCKKNKTFVAVVQSLSCVRLCDHMEYSMPDSPVLLSLPEFVQIHVH